MSKPIHVVCPHCDSVNRLPAERLGEQPRCGKCRDHLFTARPIELDKVSFAKHISNSDIPILVDFWAPWCGPCKMMAPQFKQAATQLEPRVRLAKVNTEAEQTLGAKYNIRSIPTMALFRGGREIARQPGAMSAADIVRWTNTHAKV